MGFLLLPGEIAPFKKMVMSFWFRVPQQTWEAAASESIPLVAFSKPEGETKKVSPIIKQVAVPANFPGPLPNDWNRQVVGWQTYDSEPTSPCYVALDAQTLTFVIQTEGYARVSDMDPFVPLSMVYSPFVTPYPPAGYNPAIGSGWGGPNFISFCAALGDCTAAHRNARPEYFMVEASKEVEPDQWHHLLWSFDISEPCITNGPSQLGTSHPHEHETISQGVVSACKFWYALDDVNYDGEDNLGPYFVEGGDDRNAILTENAYDVADSETGIQHNLLQAPAACSFESPPIRVHKNSFGIPAAAPVTRRVQMAEFQFFAGVSLNTNEIKNRRVFVTGGGLPVSPVGSLDGDGNRIPPPAEQVLGKRPDVLLTESDAWSRGYNTGSRGFNYTVDPPQMISSGQFMPTGNILAWTPDPSLSPPTPPVRLAKKTAAVS